MGFDSKFISFRLDDYSKLKETCYCPVHMQKGVMSLCMYDYYEECKDSIIVIPGSWIKYRFVFHGIFSCILPTNV